METRPPWGCRHNVVPGLGRHARQVKATLATAPIGVLLLALLAGCSGMPGSGPVPPEPVSPKAGASFDHFPRTTVLSWRPVPDAVFYSVEVDCFHCCEVGKWCTELDQPRITDSHIRTTTYTFSWVGANLGRWRVWAVAADGKAGPKSPWQEFLYTR